MMVWLSGLISRSVYIFFQPFQSFLPFFFFGIYGLSRTKVLLSGPVGNLIDRVFLGEVVDFLDFMIGNYHWYVFNLADSYVTVGMGFILYDSLILERK